MMWLGPFTHWAWSSANFWATPFATLLGYAGAQPVLLRQEPCHVNLLARVPRGHPAGGVLH